MAELAAIPVGDLTLEQVREVCLLQWRCDFSPSPDAAARARAQWDSRPPGAVINAAANRELWQDRETEDLCLAAARIRCPVTLIFGADDPRPWTASDSLLAALPDTRRVVLDRAGHAPWTERPLDTRQAVIDALRPAAGDR
jgi:proline iminopeptidase